MSEYDGVEVYVTISGQAIEYPGGHERKVSSWAVEGVHGGAWRGNPAVAKETISHVITGVMSFVSQISEGYIMAYQCDAHPDRPALVLFTALEGGDVNALCPECVPQFAAQICREMGWTVTDTPAPGTTPKVTNIASGSTGKRRRPAKGTKDTDQQAGESTSPELADHCDGQVSDGCTGRGLPRPDLVNLQTPEAATSALCEPCYLAVKAKLAEYSDQMQTAEETYDAARAAGDDEKTAYDKAIAAAGGTTEG